MSYVKVPRLHFSGRFQADTPTANKFAKNYDSSKFQPRYEKAEVGGFRPRGSGCFNLIDCRVSGAVYRDGTFVNDPRADPVIGMAIGGSESRVAGKMVDLDPMQRRVTEIWGLKVVLGDAGSTNGFCAHLAVASFADIWSRSSGGSQEGRAELCAYYQSELRNVTWSKVVDSRLIGELTDGERPSRLSVKFTLDGYDYDPSSPTFTLGRVIGAIGLVLPGEPVHFVAERLLRPTASSPLHFAPAAVSDSWLSVDFGNCLPTRSSGGPLIDLGILQLALIPKTAPPVLLGEVPYLDLSWLESQAGIHSLELSLEQQSLAEYTPLGVVRMKNKQIDQVYLREQENGALVRSDDLVFRLNPGDQVSARLYAREFGRPFAGASIRFRFDDSSIAQMAQGLPAATPKNALSFPEMLETDRDGIVELSLTAGDPGNPREFIDGQVYGVGYEWLGVDGAVYDGRPSETDEDGSPQTDNAGASGLLNVLVWDAFEVPATPTWADHIQPIFQQYANLYPAMKPIVDLSDRDNVIAKRHLLEIAFSLPESDPNSMPVTRDLSRSKRETVLKWLRGQVSLSVDKVSTISLPLASVEDLRAALQQALVLEHAIIPPYLCALYSIKAGYNQEVATIIRSVVIEEMIHMALCCNLLNAIGGQPRLGQSGFVPQYPTQLPEGLRPELLIKLRKCSIEQIRDVFMSIEEPEETTEQNPLTIGAFYHRIEDTFERLSRSTNLFVGDPARQLREWPSVDGELVVVTDLESAKAAIGEIIEQGEGASPLDPNDESGALAHYFRFEEIVRGRRLVIGHGGFDFTGEPLPFDPDGVWPMMDDPDTFTLEPGSRARILSEQFNRAYLQMLNALDRVFNGHPEELNSAIGVMQFLHLAATELMETPNGLSSGETVGPSFQLPDS